VAPPNPGPRRPGGPCGSGPGPEPPGSSPFKSLGQEGFSPSGSLAGVA
jgi:hypothetical protein